MIELLTTEDVSKRLHKSPRWLQDFLRRNPVDRHGRPFFRLAGRTKLFTDADILRILEALAMPLKLVPPRKGKTPFWYVRGTYLGQFVDRSTKTDRKAIARKFIEKWQREIECGEFALEGEPTFLSAAVNYLKHDGHARPVHRLIEHFGEKPLRQIGQAEIDAAALTLFPNHTPATRNREVYTPVSAILKQAGIDRKDKKAEGVARTRIDRLVMAGGGPKTIQGGRRSRLGIWPAVPFPLLYGPPLEGGHGSIQDSITCGCPKASPISRQPRTGNQGRSSCRPTSSRRWRTIPGA